VELRDGGALVAGMGPHHALRTRSEARLDAQQKPEVRERFAFPRETHHGLKSSASATTALRAGWARRLQHCEPIRATGMMTRIRPRRAGLRSVRARRSQIGWIRLGSEHQGTVVHRTTAETCWATSLPRTEADTRANRRCTRLPYCTRRHRGPGIGRKRRCEEFSTAARGNSGRTGAIGMRSTRARDSPPSTQQHLHRRARSWTARRKIGYASPAWPWW